MATTDDKPKKKEKLRDALDFIFGFKNKRGDELDSWLRHAEGFNGSPQEFYNNVEQELAAKKIPGMKISREEFAVGGLLSDRRTYLRLMRERFTILTCAAPFGEYFFFSCRTVHVPAKIRLWHILAALIFFSVVGQLLIIPLGFNFAIIALVTLLFAIAGVLRNAADSAFTDLDQTLLAIPVVATYYEDWFRQETYYRVDTRSLYLSVLPDLIEKLAEDTCGGKGIRLQPNLQRPPAVANLDQPLLPEKTPPAA
jgi:hypothetical protein